MARLRPELHLHDGNPFGDARDAVDLLTLDEKGAPARVRIPTMWASGIAAVTISIDLTILNVAFPQLADDLGGGIETIQWVASIYSLMYAVFLVPAGRLADLLGVRRLLMLGLFVFMGSSAVAGAAPDPVVMIAARALQGLGAAMVAPAAGAAVAKVYDKDHRGIAYGWVGAALGVASGFGPLVGGVIVETVGWRGVFFLGLPFAGLAALLIAMVPILDADVSEHVDLNIVGTLLFGMVVLGIQMVLIESDRRGLVPFGLVALGGAAAFALLTWLHERNQREPIVALGLLEDRVVAGAVVAKFVVNFGYYGSILYLVLFIQGTLGYSPLETGLILVPSTLLGVASSPLIGKWVTSQNARAYTTAGLAIMAASLFLLGLLESDSSLFWHVLPGILLNGLGFALVAIPTRVASTNAVEPAKHARVNSLVGMSGKIAVGIGVAFTAGVFHAFSTGNAERSAEAYTLPDGFTADDIRGCLAVQDLESHLTDMLGTTPSASDLRTINAAIDDAFVWTLTDAFVVTAIVVVVATGLTWALMGGRRRTDDGVRSG